jgi:hypothetical protein
MANECIPYYLPGSEITTHNASGATIEGKRLVVCSAAPGTDGNVRVARCGAGVRSDGVNKWDQVNGAKGAMHCDGVVPVTSGAAVDAGDEVECDGSGRVIPLDAGVAVGRAWTTVGAASLDVKVHLY